MSVYQTRNTSKPHRTRTIFINRNLEASVKTAIRVGGPACGGRPRRFTPWRRDWYAHYHARRKADTRRFRPFSRSRRL